MSQQESEQVVVTLPDGSEMAVDPGTTVEEVAYEIGPGLGDDTVAGVVDGELLDKATPLTENATLEIVTPSSDEYLRCLRHTAAHVFAQALQRLYPEAKLAIGPPTDEGFYYDVSGVDIDAADLEEIEAEMEAIIEADYDLRRELRDRDTVLEAYADNRFKRDILNTEAAGEDPVSVYVQDGWEDLCQGPHVDSTGEIGAVSLLEISAAYWRGEEENDQLTRVYGTAFESESDLESFLERRRKAAERDHRKIGRELDLFSIDETAGPGLPLYHPNGRTVLSELESYVDELNEQSGYDYVETPHLFKTDLWKKSGHYENYRDDMFLFELGDEEFGLKPMNCPGHATIFDDGSWSYRDLPVRYAEHGKVYRKEQRGELSGLSRTWAFTIDDGHLFVTPDQIEAEVRGIMEMIEAVLDTFDLKPSVDLATRPEKSMGSDAVWEQAESQLESVLEESGFAYGIESGDGAFYGPKIDFSFGDALGRSWDGPTVQLDFMMPERFDLSYTGEDNESHRPVMIHRALYGSYERFFMVLIEHFNGKFPLWLAPEQVRILPISDRHEGYAREVAGQLDSFRVDIEDRDWTIGRKIAEGHEDRIPYMIIVGDDEEKAGTISVRDRAEREADDVSVAAFRDHLTSERAEKRTDPDFIDRH
jgi:threonyl-tRNA synthetase